MAALTRKIFNFPYYKDDLQKSHEESESSDAEALLPDGEKESNRRRPPQRVSPHLVVIILIASHLFVLVTGSWLANTFFFSRRPLDINDMQNYC
jgi:hypothetical protein